MSAESVTSSEPALALLSISPRLLGDPARDPQLADLVDTAEALVARARTMFSALEILYREGILEDSTIRPMRKQRELDAKALLERYKILLARYRARRQSAPSPEQDAEDTEANAEGSLTPDRVASVIGAILIEVDALERLYLHEKVVLKTSTDLAGIREEVGHLARVAGDFRGSSVAYGAEEKLAELRKTEAALERDLHRAQLERKGMRLETELLVAESLLAGHTGAEREASERAIKVLETKLHRLHEELTQLPARAPTRRGPFVG